MQKSVAHAILALFDIAALGAAYYAITQRELALSLAESQAATIQYQSVLGFYLLLLLVPLIHGVALFEAFKPLQHNIKKVLNYCLVGALALSIAGAVMFTRSIDARLALSGYQYCELKSESLTFSTYKFFVREPEQCADN